MVRSQPLRHLLAAAAGGMLLLGSGPLQAQRLMGLVREEGTSEPVVAANITIIDGEGRELRSSVTDSAGFFLFSVAAPGAYRLRVTHVAFTSYDSEMIDLARGETVELEVWLGRNVIPLEPLVVTARNESLGRLAEFHERLETRAFGRFVTREDIEARPAARVTDLLRTMAGVRILTARRGAFESPLIAMRGAAGNCSPALYIDGVRVRQSADYPIDDLLSPDMLEGAEIYTTVAGAPSQYQAGANCGVILFWTRQGEPGRPFSWKRLLIGLSVAGLVILLAR